MEVYHLFARWPNLIYDDRPAPRRFFADRAAVRQRATTTARTLLTDQSGATDDK